MGGSVRVELNSLVLFMGTIDMIRTIHYSEFIQSELVIFSIDDYKILIYSHKLQGFDSNLPLLRSPKCWIDIRQQPLQPSLRPDPKIAVRFSTWLNLKTTESAV